MYTVGVSEPATKQDLNDFLGVIQSYVDKVDNNFKTYVDQRLAGTESTLKTYVDQRLAISESDMKASVDNLETKIVHYVDHRAEGVETRLLTAFHGWARAMEMRVRQNTTLTVGFDERLSLLEERVSELERKKAS